MDILQSIDPTVVAIVLGLIVLSFIIMMLIYIPRVEKLRELENDKKRYKAERDYAVEQWSIAMISGNRQKDRILQDLKNTEGRKNQFSKISKKMAEAYDKLKGRYGIDILKQEYDIMTFWHEMEADPPKEDGRYLVCKFPYYAPEGQVYTSRYSLDLFKVDDLEFNDKKGQPGWYYYNDEWGYKEETGIEYWAPLPKPPKKEKKDDNELSELWRTH